MFKKIAETVIGGAIGALALYAVGKLAYQAGQEVAREECRYNAMRLANAKMKEMEHPSTLSKESVSEESLAIVETAPTPSLKKKQSKLGLLLGARKLFGNRKSVIGGLVQNPEDHKFEAFVQGNELQIHVKRREGC